MARLVHPYYEQIADSDGNPIASARAYTFETGGYTPYEVYTDSALSVGHGDYIEADSAGRFPAAYADPDQGLRIEYRLSDGTTVIDGPFDDVYAELDGFDETASLTALGIAGTAAGTNVGTSGDALGKLNTANTWSALQTFTANITLSSTDAGASAAPNLILSRLSATPAASDLIGELSFYGYDNAGTPNLIEYGSVRGKINDPTSASPSGMVQVTSMQAGSKTVVAEFGAFDVATETLVGLNLPSGQEYFTAGFYARGTPLALLEHQEETPGTDAGTFTQATDVTRPLNTEVFDTFNLVTIGSNQFTLQPGTYIIKWSAPAHRVRVHQTFLYDITGTAEVKRGTSEYADDISASESEPIQIQTRSFGMARVTIASANVYEIRHRCTLTNTTTGLGAAGGLGTEVYLQVEIYAG